MLSVEITGLDKLQRELGEMQRAFQALDGTIATLQFRPDDPESVQAAIQEMEAAVDAKVAPYRGNAVVETIAQKSKEAYRERILEMAASPQQ
jgi:hypothetical protein